MVLLASVQLHGELKGCSEWLQAWRGKTLGACLGLTVAAKAAKVHLVEVLKRSLQVDNHYSLDLIFLC